MIHVDMIVSLCLPHVTVCFLVAVIKHWTKETWAKGGFILTYRHSQWSRKAKAGIWRWEQKQRPRRNTGLLSYLSYTAKAHHRLGPATSIINKKMSHSQASLMGAVPQVSFCLSWYVFICVNWTKNNQHNGFCWNFWGFQYIQLHLSAWQNDLFSN